MNATDQPWRIPYGVADFIKLRDRGHYFVDKTAYLPLLEQAGEFLFLIRPRRFGKSLLQSVMECYYDAHWVERFDTLFADTWISAHPTPEKGQYLTLRFDFSAVRSSPALVEESFEAHIRILLIDFFKRHKERLAPEISAAVLNEPSGARRIERLAGELRELGLSLYLFIDEYDNFANNILVNAGREAYRELTHSSGFFRDFFALLKEAAGRTGSGLARLFITGVSPITLDDVTSGFNIGTNISLEPEFSALLGFTHAELETLFAAFGQEFSAHRAVIDEWYNHYHFHPLRQEPIVNSDMALYYLRALVQRSLPPDELIDHNVRIDYGKLRHLVQVDQRLSDRERLADSARPETLPRLNGNFSRLRAIIESGEVAAQVQTSFPAEGLLRQDNFISLIYYLGLLSFAGECEGRPLLKIPNRTVRQLMYGYLRDGYQEAGVFSPSTYDIAEKLNHMAYRGDWMPFFDYLAEQIAAQASVRDFLAGEKMIQGFLLAWLNLSPYFRVFSESEQAGGFVDLYLAPFYFKFPDMRHAYLIELKYVSRAEDSPAQRERLLDEARAQLRRYAGDARVRDPLGEARLNALVLLYSGWELVHREALDLAAT
ncbi:AAA family ATPase [Thiorhodococcus mannitoliphagus]|uniref:AAA family ATPase n=1 Tax=Thiorhodococcus mannitoliphagus TaxID=329406 RepID=A0A6P1E0R4_9GAMM|nr:AAA family ATPase [Thiorhodococcus mannitoliphagus]NEX22901.1 AAA family ATPase [Thiorhodococcus mannitoliphagus]